MVAKAEDAWEWVEDNGMGVAVKAVDNLEWVVDNGTVEGIEKVGIELVEDGHEREVDI